MNRRGFLGILAGATLDPERLLWVPGKKLISIPSPGTDRPPFIIPMRLIMKKDFEKLYPTRSYTFEDVYFEAVYLVDFEPPL